MKQQFILSVALLCFGLATLRAQVTCDPVFPNTDDNVTIYFHANEGNAALSGSAGPIYAHMGVITNLSQSPSDWKYVKTTWGVADANGLLTLVSPNLWKKTYNIRSFHNIPANETVLKLAFVFRNASGSVVGRAADGGDIFYDVYPDDNILRTKFLTPAAPSFVANNNQSIAVKAAASESASLVLTDNGTTITTGSGLSLETTLTASAGFHQIEFIATTASNGADTSRFSYLVPGDVAAQDPPAGTVWGVNEINGQTVRIALYAPEKSNVFLLGDFNDWKPNLDYQMRKDLSGKLWWIEVAGLVPGQVYRYQFLVDGVLKVADPLSTLVLQPGDDSYIPAVTYPDIPAYPIGKTTGTVSVFTTGATPFNWQATNYTRPKKTDLVVYELLLRDFLARHDYETLLDTLDYLQNLGVTAIELMPVNEFDGNINWGYGPSFHRALDKYYGTADAFKTFIDACHQRDIAVILDVVFNQATGASPLAQLYWDSANNRPATNNPWLNPVATHPFNVFNDFNHESTATRTYTKQCVDYWLREFHIDGYRFDLSKGFTQKNTGSNVSAWGQYDATRVAIWKDYADFIWAIDDETYVILEHFADNTEEKELAQYGMMLWGNMWGAYKEVALGYPGGVNTSLAGISYIQRGWSVPHLVGYMESHDEDRIAYECKTYGNTVSGYNVKALPTAMRRIEMLEQLFYTIPGPKMLWQFGELGYDYPINWCENGSLNESCRTSPKPIKWDYLADPNRRRLHDVTASLLKLRQQFDVFETTNFTLEISSGQVRSVFLNGTDLNVAVFANIGTTSTTVNNPAFQHVGEWYEYYTGDTLFVGSGVPTSFSLQPGAYRLYLDAVVALPPGVDPTPTVEQSGVIEGLGVSPNPATDGFAVQFTLLEPATIRADVRDQLGRIVTTLAPQRLPDGRNAWWVDTADWQPGVYMVTVQDENGASSTRTVVKI